MAKDKRGLGASVASETEAKGEMRAARLPVVTKPNEVAILVSKGQKAIAENARRVREAAEDAAAEDEELDQLANAADGVQAKPRRPTLTNKVVRGLDLIQAHIAEFQTEVGFVDADMKEVMQGRDYIVKLLAWHDARRAK